MLKRIGVLAFVLTAGALMGSAAERGHGQVVEHRDTTRVEQQFRRDDHQQPVRRDDRVEFRPVHKNYYAPVPNCAYQR